MKSVIVTVAIGDHCRRMWDETFAPSVYDYADRHGYAVQCLTAPIDVGDKAKPASWQRLLLASHPALLGFDRIIYLDTDIMCNPSAPGVAELVPDGKIGAVTWQGSYNNDQAWYDMFKMSWSRNVFKWIRDAKIESFSDLAVAGGYPAHEDWLNSGVLVFQPTPEIATLMADVYYNEPHTERSANEQQALTHYLCNKRPDLLHPLDKRFNAIWYFEREIHYPFLENLYLNSFIASKCVEASLTHNYFLHFAADGERLEAVNFMLHQHLLTEAA